MGIPLGHLIISLTNKAKKRATKERYLHSFCPSSAFPFILIFARPQKHDQLSSATIILHERSSFSDAIQNWCNHRHWAKSSKSFCILVPLHFQRQHGLKSLFNYSNRELLGNMACIQELNLQRQHGLPLNFNGIMAYSHCWNVERISFSATWPSSRNFCVRGNMAQNHRWIIRTESSSATWPSSRSLTSKGNMAFL
jgi:hypothetical protein